MYTSEFIEKVEALPFVSKVKRPTNGKFMIVHQDVLALVGTDAMYLIDTNWHGFRNLHNDERVQLMYILWQYISTPVDEREPEKRYMYKLPSDFDVRNVLTLSLSIEKYFFSRVEHEIYREGTLMYQKYFTDKEVEMMPADVINVLKACVKEEVD